jgi:hypothetical protein
MATLPHLEIGDAQSPFDEAVIIINGHEEETIRIECEGALELADLLIRLVNEARSPAPPADEQQTPYLAARGIDH